MIRNLIGALLVLGAIYGGYTLYLEKANSERLANNPWATRLAPLVRLHTARQMHEGGEAASHASFFTILYLAWQAQESGYNDMETLKRAAASAGAGASEAARIAAAVHDNISFAKSMDVFSDPSNPIRLERGDPPIAHSKGWEDEVLVVGHLLSPLLAPEAAFALPNLRLMPEAVRDMRTTERASKATVELARKWASDKIIFPETVETISNLVDQRERM